MKLELSITVDEDEIDVVKEVISAVDDGESAISLLSERERYVLRALWQNRSGAARRVIHQDAAALNGSSFTDPNTNGKERDEVGSILSKLAEIGLAEREKSTWYPSENTKLVDEMELAQAEN